MEPRSPTLKADSLPSEPSGNLINIILQLTIDVHLKFVEGRFHVTAMGRKTRLVGGDLEIFTVRNGSKIMVTLKLYRGWFEKTPIGRIWDSLSINIIIRIH